MPYRKNTHLRLIPLNLLMVLLACTKSPVDPGLQLTVCNDSTKRLDIIVDGTTQYVLTIDGDVYKDSAGECKFSQKYFSPGFEKENYSHIGNRVFLKTPDGPFPTRTEILEPFERYAGFHDIFLTTINDTDKYWNAMTLLSPQALTIPEYVALRTCILNGTCTFKDNRIDLAPDPTGVDNRVLKFMTVAPTAEMITSKSSLESTIGYFVIEDDLWYQARYFFTENFPYSIADFESQWFDLSPGPRIVFDNGALAVENKFGVKQKYRQANPVVVPRNQWVNIKVHFKFHPVNGILELWQDGNKILSATGPTLPLSMAVQTNIEFGISAAETACILYVDDVRISKSEF